MDNSSGRKGIGLMGVVQVILIILKLFKLIDWSWGQVLIPLWIDIAMILILVIVNAFLE